jgi:hypothetical protein
MKASRLLFIITCLVDVACLVAACVASPPTTPTAEPAAIRTSALPESSPTSLPTMTAPALPTATPTPEPSPAAQMKDFTLATSADEIVGTWHESGDYIRFDEDGTFRQAHGLDKLDDQPYAICSYQFEGTIMIIEEISVSGVPSCKRKIGSYEIQLLENGDIEIVTIEDQCPPRARDISGEKKPAVSPTP